MYRGRGVPCDESILLLSSERAGRVSLGLKGFVLDAE
jgi:hypothetical protein